MKSNSTVQNASVFGSKGLYLSEKRRDNPLSKPKSIKKHITIFPYIPFIELSLRLKRSLGLSTPCLYLLFIILSNSINDIDNTASRFSDQFYGGGGKHNGLRSIYSRIKTLMLKGLVYKEGKNYYLTERAIEAVNNISLE